MDSRECGQNFLPLASYESEGRFSLSLAGLLSLEFTPRAVIMGLLIAMRTTDPNARTGLFCTSLSRFTNAPSRGALDQSRGPTAFAERSGSMT